MEDMTTAPLHKNQAGQPSDNGGHFATLPLLDDETVVLIAAAVASDAEKRQAHVTEMCDGAGYAGVMPGVYELLLDRHDVGSPMHGAIDELTATEVNDAYDEYIDYAVTDASAWLTEYVEPNHFGASVEDHTKTISDAAGYAGVMPGFIEAILEREDHSDDMVAFVNGMNADDVETMYERFVGPAVSNLEDSILMEACSVCGSSLSDNEGYDGKCGSCADEASCSGCGNELEATDDGGLCEDCTPSEDDEEAE
jgi:hypothetical protein